MEDAAAKRGSEENPEMQARIRELVDKAPPISPMQHERLRRILSSAARSAQGGVAA